MNAVKRQIFTGIGVAFCSLALFAALFFFTFPLHKWSLLWERQILHLPFVFIVPVLSLLAGGISGLLSGFFWHRQLLLIGDALDRAAQGKERMENSIAASSDIVPLLDRTQKLGAQISQLTKMAQQAANDKSEIEEKAIQKIVSEERNRLARELHDSVSQQLFAASMLMSTIIELRPREDDDEGRQLKLVEQTIQQSQLEMRALFLHLRPVQLHGKALKQGMEELLLELRQKVPLNIQATIETVKLERGVEDQLFRILQESVSNTLRHAKAKNLDVLLIRREDFVILRVTDDGIGFEIKAAKPGSYGLQNMKERAAQIGAQMKLISVPGRGTSLEIKVPVIEGGLQ